MKIPRDVREFFKVTGYAMAGFLLPFAIVGILYAIARVVIYLTTK